MSSRVHGLAGLALGMLLTLPAHAELSRAEQRLLEAIQPARVAEEIQRIMRSADGIPQGVGAGSVVAGSAEEAELAEDLAGTLRELGLETRIETFPVRSYRYAVPRLQANGQRIEAISLHAAGAVSGLRDGVPFARGNEDGGKRLRAPLVDAGDGYAADYARIGAVRGKAVLVRREQQDWPPAQVTEAALHGATAILFYDHPSAGDRLDALRQDSLWGHEQLPTLAISIRSARDLQRQLAAGTVELTLQSQVEITDGLSRNVVGVLRGSELADQWVLVSGHYDRWFQGALDNASGTAAVLEMARAFVASGVRPRRSVMFLAVGSEEAGLEDPERDWLAGSHAFLQAHPEVFRNAALVFNVDGIGWTPAAAKLSTTPDQLAIQRAVLQDLALTEEVELRPLTGSTIDAWNYGVLGGAATNALLTWDASYTPLYHTQEDLFLPARFANMERDLRVLGLSLVRAATVARVTPSLSALADFVRQRLAEDASRLPGVPFTEVEAALAEFRAAASTLEHSERPGEQLDRALTNVRHALVPWLYAANGDYQQALRTDEYVDRVVALDRAIEALGAGDRAAALAAIAVMYEGRQCQRLSAQSYAIERAFWAGESGWSSRFGHRAPPPLPDFDAACRALVAAGDDPQSVRAGFARARDEARLGAEQSLALMAAKLRLATMALHEYAAGH